MASTSWQVHLDVTSPARFAQVSALWARPNVLGLADDGGLGTLRPLAFSQHEGKDSEGLQELVSDPTQWWDNWRSTRLRCHPDFRNNKSRVGRYSQPTWIDSQPANSEAGKKRPCGSASSSVRGPFGWLTTHESGIEVGTCTELCEHGPASRAVDALDLMVQQGFRIPNNLFYRALKRCSAEKDLVLGRRIHALTVKSGYEGDSFLATHLIGLYASHGMLHEAMQVFSKVARPDVYNWSAIIFAYARHGEPTQAIGLYGRMRESSVKPDNRIFLAVLKACATAGNLATGKDVHAQLLATAGKPDLFVQTCLVDMYAKCGNLEDARRVFDRLSQKDVVTWTSMIAGYAQQGLGKEALSLYDGMQEEGITPPNSITFVSLLQACSSVGAQALHQGMKLHAQTEQAGLQHDVLVGGSLVNMYSKCGSLNDARRVFDTLPHRNVVTWNAMIASYAQQGRCQEALSLYGSMQQAASTQPNAVTFTCLLQACASVGAIGLHQGKLLHAQIEVRGFGDDVVVGASLVNMYAKCGSILDAAKVFDRLPQKNVVTWTAMITGYSQQGMGQEALNLYTSMRREGINPPDSVTFVCLLQACATVAALPLGKQLHSQIEETGLQADVVVGPSLVNMYAKCGSMVDSQQVFDSLPERDIMAWGALAAGYTRQGDSDIVFGLLDRMRLEGMQPDGVMFLSVLTVCSHVGLVDKGRKYFKAMSTDYGISPTIEHYTCMMDLLGRAGYLDEALGMAKSMPFTANAAVWLTLLGSCRKWRNVEIGRQAFDFAVSLDEKGASSYVLMSNIYASLQMWDEAKEIQTRRVKLGAWKQPGQSWWTDMGGVVHTFGVGDKKHPESEGIYARLDQLVPKMKKEGYVPHLGSSLRDIPDDEKEAELCGHSERLAIAYALNKTPEGTTIRIVKNLRVCVDCHSATAFISKVEERTIICRDASRFHVYNHGKCSCGNYW